MSGTILSLQTVRSGVLAGTATMSQASPARLCLQAPANPAAKSRYLSWDPRQGLWESHSYPTASSSSIQALQEASADPGDVL